MRENSRTFSRFAPPPFQRKQQPKRNGCNHFQAGAGCETMAPLVANGYLSLGFQELVAKDVRKILQKLQSSDARERRPRKCRRLQGVGAILAELPHPNPIWKINLVGNAELGDEVTKYLPLIPHTVKDLDLSDCGLTAAGVKDLCDFMKTNTSIVRLIMWGNSFGDEGAKSISEMLMVNKTLRILCISWCDLGDEGCSHLSLALGVNDALRVLDVADAGFQDKHIVRLCSGMVFNRGLEMLDLGNPELTDVGIGFLEHVVKSNHCLKSFGRWVSGDFARGDCFERILWSLEESHYGDRWATVRWWLRFNKCGRRVIHDGNASLNDWGEALCKGSKQTRVDFSFELLRSNPALCTRR
jgi:hypothetical protein